MTPSEYAAHRTCQHCGRSAHRITWPCAVMAVVLNGGFALLTAVTRPSSGSPAHDSHIEA
jgi:hypothetical protein